MKSSDEFRNLNLDKLTKRELKSADEISKHTVDAYLETRSVDRAMHLLTVGNELQKISVMKNLPYLIREDLTACLQRLVPRMQQTLLTGTTEYNMGACEAVRTIAVQNLISPDDTKVFLQHILTSLESRDTVAAEEWLNVLLDIIQVLPVSMLQSEVYPMAVSKAHISKPVPVRITSCKILGKLALSFSPFLVKKDIVPVVISLCQDVSGDVRAEMSKQLPSVATTLGLETGNCLLNHVLDLISDEEENVRQAAIEAVAHMLPNFSQEILKNTIIPLTKKVFLDIMKNEDNLLLVLSKFYGQYAIGLKGVMSVPDKTQFVQRYIQLSMLNANTKQKLNPYKPIVVDEEEMALRLTECRLNCAYNYPAMVMFVADLKQDVIELLYPVLKSLASDSFCQVRKKIAAGFYELMKLMPKWHQSLKIEFIKLLKDTIDIVLEGLVPNVANILLGFAASGTISLDKPDSGKEIGQALFLCEKNLNDSFRWRLHEELLLAFRAVPKVFHPEFVFMYFVPLLMSRASCGRILPCRVAALHTLLVIIVDPTQAKQKLKIRNRILELCNNSSSHCRMLFLRGMAILQNLSPEVLKELFFHNITSMAEDNIANIRLMVCKLLPKLKLLASDPMDRKLLASVDACVNTLDNETDRDVIAQLKVALHDMDDLKECKTGTIRKSNKKGGEQTSVDNPMRTPAKNFAKDDKNLKSISSGDSLHYGARPGAVMSTYTVANQPPISSHSPSVSSTSSSPGPFAQAQSGRIAARTPKSSTNINTTSNVKKPSASHKLSNDEFIVDAGVPLRSATVVLKRIPTPRPVHRPIIAVETNKETQNNNDTRDSAKKSLSYSPIPARACSTLTNKNLNLANRPSSLPVKKMNFKPLTKEEIETELMESDSKPYSPRCRLKNASKPNKLDKKENKRLSLDPTELSYAYSRMETRALNLNKRMSMDVDSKKDFANRKMSYMNNNFMSPKLGSTRSGIVRPQSCVLQEEKVNHSKRSMSVENLPPKVTRLASRLPVRANNDPKQAKPK